MTYNWVKNILADDNFTKVLLAAVFLGTSTQRSRIYCIKTVRLERSQEASLISFSFARAPKLANILLLVHLFNGFSNWSLCRAAVRYYRSYFLFNRHPPSLPQISPRLSPKSYCFLRFYLYSVLYRHIYTRNSAANLLFSVSSYYFITYTRSRVNFKSIVSFSSLAYLSGDF